MTRLHDVKTYQNASHADLLTLTRALLAMPLGELTKLHKEKAKELGATAPSAVFIRAVLFSRLATGRVAPAKV